MLGIIIGVGAVITMLAAGAGAQKRIDEQIASLGANILTVNTSNFFAGGVSRDSQSLVIDDANDCAPTALSRRGSAGNAGPRSIQARKRENDARLSGTTPSIRDLQLQARVGPVSSTPRTTPDTASAWSCSAPTFRSGSRRTAQDLVGKMIAVNGQPFEVIGVFESIGGGFGNNNPGFVGVHSAAHR